jgi:hypothetical protein
MPRKPALRFDASTDACYEKSSVPSSNTLISGDIKKSEPESQSQVSRASG